MRFKTLLLSFVVAISCKSLNVDYFPITIEGNKLLVNNELYVIKGICYHPVPKNSSKRDFSNLTEDLSLMTELGINTIRVYEPIDDKAVLDEIAFSGIKLIIGFGYNQNGIYDIASGTYLDYIEKYKKHSAILMWELGNEYNYHPEWFKDDIANWYRAMNTAALEIKGVDGNHPVTTAHGELPDDLALRMSPNIDVWGMNVYRWDNPKAIFIEWNSISKKPMYLSEAGGDSYMTITKSGYKQGENQKAQADANKKILDVVFENLDVTLGVSLFSFTDGWWKAGENDKQNLGGRAPNSTGVPYDGTPNEEYWGVVDIDRNRKETFEIIKTKYNSISDTN
ncbi:hypothetical protein BFP77_05700 [Maribacter sp. 4U21]|uniref:glycoside hydrolase family 2 TIM barrel-domain containing protein n=1 Tax=Maribacter sp. 4U21 TaxID=1889779 RepID=UPI000C418B52|nr:glycoside hydrolase family 2 TIM barrel-domain containing protein [Maribacter sp. 4U21]PIB29643.1 hypothetical protein BFP77_05700 [Maribacter sp. 4U21]